MTTKDNEGKQRQGNRYNKSDDLLADLQPAGCIWSSARWVISIAGMVEV